MCTGKFSLNFNKFIPVFIHTVHCAICFGTSVNIHQTKLTSLRPAIPSPSYHEKKELQVVPGGLVYRLECAARNGQTGNSGEKSRRVLESIERSTMSVFMGSASASVLRADYQGPPAFPVPVYAVATSVSTYNNIPKHVNTLEWHRRDAVGPCKDDGQSVVAAKPTSAKGRRDVVSPPAT